MTAQMGMAMGWLMLGLTIVGGLGAAYLFVRFAYNKPFMFLITVVVVGSILAYKFG